MTRAAAIGIKVRTGRCIAIVLGGDPNAPDLLHREELRTFDPAFPESQAPYHAGLELEPREAEPLIAAAAQAVRRASAVALQSLLVRITDAQRLAGMGLVVSSVSDPEAIANPHMRAHAAEGRLFYEALFDAGGAAGLACATFLERELPAQAARALGRDEAALARAVAAIGKPAGPPWRAFEKAACLAAWLRLDAAARD